MRIAGLAFGLLGIVGSGANNINFDALRPGAAPPNWTLERARWEVRLDPTAPSRPNVLELASNAHGGNGASDSDSPLAVFNPVVCRDGELTVKFKIEAEGQSRTAGVVWRYTDAKNYYLLDFSAERKNIAIYRMQNGVAQVLPVVGGKPGETGVTHEIRAGQWYVARVIFRGSRIRVLFGNRRLFDVEDSSMLSSGKAGVWTKGRTSASFDDFRIDKKG